MRLIGFFNNWGNVANMVDKIREIIELIGILEYKEKYIKQIKRNTDNFGRKILVAAILPFISLFISVIIAGLIVGFYYTNLAGGALTIIMSMGVIIFSGIVLAIHSVLRKIGKTVERLVKIGFEIVKEVVEKTHNEQEINVNEIIDNVINLIILPKTGEIIKGTFKYFGYKIGNLIEKYIDIVLTESIAYLKEVMKSREIAGYASIKADKYNEIINNFIQQELYDMQKSSGKFSAMKIKELLVKIINRIRGNEKVKDNIGKLGNFINDKSIKNNSIDAFEKSIFSKTSKSYGKIVFFIGLAGNLVLLLGVAQIVLLCFAVSK